MRRRLSILKRDSKGCKPFGGGFWGQCPQTATREPGSPQSKQKNIKLFDHTFKMRLNIVRLLVHPFF